MGFLEQYEASELKGEAKAALVSGWIGTDSKEFFAELRRDRPIFVSDGPVVVTRYADVQEVLSRHKVFSVRMYAPKMDPCVGPFMLARDSTTINERDKSIMTAMLRREDLPRVRDIVTRLAEASVEAGGGRLEIVGGLTRKVPIELCGEYFGFPGPDLATMMRWSKTANFDFFYNADDEAAHQAAVDAGQEMKDYVDALIERRRGETSGPRQGDDILSRLLRSSFPDVLGFDDERIRANIMFLLIGGVETVSGATVLMIDELLRRPEELAGAQQAARDDDDQLLGRYLWEALRLNPIFPCVGRYCEEDYTLASGTERETRIKEGSVVLACLASAMFDEAEVPEPEEFRLERSEHHWNLHFGYGHHLCLCYYLSLVEVPAIAKALLRRRGLRRAEGAAGQLSTEPFPERLTVEFDA